MWLNEHEIDSLSRQFDKDEFPNLRAGAESLQRLKDWTNGCSDGWPYWTLPAKAAGKLMAKLHEEESKRWSLLEDITDAELRQLMAPIEKFLKGRDADPALLYPPPPPPAPPARKIEEGALSWGIDGGDDDVQLQVDGNDVVSISDVRTDGKAHIIVWASSHPDSTIAWEGYVNVRERQDDESEENES